MRAALLALLTSGCSASVVPDMGVDAGMDVDTGVDLSSPDCGPPPSPAPSPTDPACPVRTAEPSCDGGAPGAYFDGVHCVASARCGDFLSLQGCARACAAVGHCTPSVRRTFIPPEYVGGECRLQVCNSLPAELCVIPGSATEALLPSFLPFDCTSREIYSPCDPSLDVCRWTLPAADGSTYPDLTPALWNEFCAASLLPDVATAACMSVLLI